jgi:hypothetical protein
MQQQKKELNGQIDIQKQYRQIAFDHLPPLA